MLMRWSPTAEADGSYGNDLLKKPGGFFIGTRPELEIAFGVVALYSQRAGKYDNVPGKENHHRVRLGENLYDIVMHPQTVRGANGQRQDGEHIRTLYPKFRGRSIPISVVDNGIDLPTQPHNDGPIQITRALPNPSTEGDVGEWIEIRNVSGSKLSLKEWQLKDRNGRAKALSGNLEPDQAIKVILDRENEQSMMLRNGTGWVLLYEGESRRAAVRYNGPKSDQIIEFDQK